MVVFIFSVTGLDRTCIGKVFQSRLFFWLFDFFNKGRDGAGKAERVSEVRGCDKICLERPSAGLVEDA